MPEIAKDVTTPQPAPKKVKVAVVGPTTKFIVEDLPTIDNKGVVLTADQRKKAEFAAKHSGVKLREVSE